jgi:hypothetical protein
MRLIEWNTLSIKYHHFFERELQHSVWDAAVAWNVTFFPITTAHYLFIFRISFVSSRFMRTDGMSNSTKLPAVVISHLK